MKYAYLLPLLPALLGSCQNDPEVAPATAIDMYTRNGPVKDPALVDAFLRRQRSTYFKRTDEAIPDGSVTRLTIRPDNSATLVSTTPTATTTVQADVTEQNRLYCTLGQRDSVSILTPAGSKSRCELLGENIKAVFPGKRCQAVSPVTGYSEFCRLRPSSVLGRRGDQLYVPVFSWLIKTTQCTSSAVQQNLFDLAILSQLTDGDTVVVQTRELPLLRK
jgi:hypothetical protein